MKLAQWVVAVVALSMVVVGGCSDKKGAAGSGENSSANQGSPKDLLEAFHKCAQAKSLAAVVDLIDPAFQKPMRTMIDAMNTMEAKVESLAKTVESKIDKETADKIREQQKKEGQNGLKSPLETAVKDGKIDWSKVKIEEKGDAATVEIDGKVADVMLKKVNGKWYAAPPAGEKDMTPEKMQAETDKIKGMMDKMVKAVDDVQKKVNDGTIKKDTFEAEYGKAMMAAMMGG